MYGYTFCYPTAPTTAPAYGYGCAPTCGRGFALIVVLFILLIIVGASCIH